MTTEKPKMEYGKYAFSGTFLPPMTTEKCKMLSAAHPGSGFLPQPSYITDLIQQFPVGHCAAYYRKLAHYDLPGD